MGPDSIQASFIKNPQCINFICGFFNKCLASGSVPSEWLKSIIQPIEKSGADPLNPSDYRGISLQSIVMKVFAVQNDRLSDYLETNNLLVDEENGFWHDRSCQDHLYTVYNLLESRKLISLQTFVCFINFHKSFDSISRDLLWKRLEHNCNIKGHFFSICKLIYNDSRLMMMSLIGFPSTLLWCPTGVFYLLPCLTRSSMTLCRIFRPLTPVLP